MSLLEIKLDDVFNDFQTLLDSILEEKIELSLISKIEVALNGIIKQIDNFEIDEINRLNILYINFLKKLSINGLFRINFSILILINKLSGKIKSRKIKLVKRKSILVGIGEELIDSLVINNDFMSFILFGNDLKLSNIQVDIDDLYKRSLINKGRQILLQYKDFVSFPENDFILNYAKQNLSEEDFSLFITNIERIFQRIINGKNITGTGMNGRMELFFAIKFWVNRGGSIRAINEFMSSNNIKYFPTHLFRHKKKLINKSNGGLDKDQSNFMSSKDMQPIYQSFFGSIEHDYFMKNEENYNNVEYFIQGYEFLRRLTCFEPIDKTIMRLFINFLEIGENKIKKGNQLEIMQLLYGIINIEKRTNGLININKLDKDCFSLISKFLNFILFELNSLNETNFNNTNFQNYIFFIKKLIILLPNLRQFIVNKLNSIGNKHVINSITI